MMEGNFFDSDMEKVRQIIRSIINEEGGVDAPSSDIEGVKIHLDPYMVDSFKNKVNKIFKPFLEFFPVPDIKLSGPFTEKKFIPNQGPGGEAEMMEITYVVAEFDVPNKINLPGGNELVAVIDNDSGTYKIIGDNKGIPNQKLRPYGACDHCGMTRARTFNFLIQDDKGEYKCVGSTCVKKYLGISPDRILRAWDLIGQMSRGYNEGPEIDPFAEFSGGGRRRTISWLNMHVSTSGLINFIYEHITNNGYIKKEFEYTDSGRKITINPDTNTFDKITKELSSMMDDNGVIVGLDDSPTIKNGLFEFFKEQRTSEFNEKILGLLNQNTISISNVAILSYACSAMLSGIKNKESTHIGQVGEKFKDVPVIMSKAREIETMYGTMYIVTFIDASGNFIIYKGSAPPKESTGTKGLLSGTIKAHDSFNNVKQTIVQRIKFQPS